MRAMFGKGWLRVVAVLLFMVSVAAAFTCLHLYTYALRDGWYGKEDYTFADCGLCREYVNQNLYYVADNILWKSDPTDSGLASYGGSAFSYTVEDAGTGDIVADARKENSYFVADYANVVTLEDGRTYRIKGYVNLPVHPYEGCYAEYYVFGQIFPLRGLFLPLLISGALLALATAVFSAAAAFWMGRQGRVTVLGHIPLDVGVVVLILAVGTLSRSLYNSLANMETHMLDMMWRIGVTDQLFYRIFMCWGLLPLVCAGAHQLGDHALRSQLILPRLMAKLSPTALTFSVAGLHILVLLYMLATNVWGRWPYIILLVFDLALLPCLIRWCVEARQICRASRSLASGELEHKIQTARLHLIWKELGEDLNRIGDGMAAAVERQMRSERMKTELITNVSHDLKTPLTSIINYISLLKEEDLPPETRQEYLDVVDRQGAKLKKLTEDVVEASKAASGVLPVHAEVLDVAELLEQSVGEYAERLRAAQIEPVIHRPEGETHIRADGRLLGRVLDNFITNIIKYAQPGTRAYFDLASEKGQTVIAVKNTSRAPLDIPAEELMERFVRGDSSRNTEGSGLGLSIARSLTELMGGQMQLILDGDLFKAQVTFPSAEALPALPAETEESHKTR